MVDDLGAITIIAVFFTESLHLLPLGGAVAVLAVYAVLQRSRVLQPAGIPYGQGDSWHHRFLAWHRILAPLVYVSLAVALWWFVYSSGIHATVAGVALAFVTRARPDRDEEHSPAERSEHRLRPLSAGIAVPVFALTSAGVPVSADALAAVASDPAAVGVIVGLVAGKTVGVFGGAWLTARLTGAELNADLEWWDILAVAVLSGIGFTVCLLVGELAFAADPDRLARVKMAILVASVTATALAVVLLRIRQRASRQVVT